ncbi:MAG TPA: AAA family ATPase [Solirubrobacteraceae bacterium]|jgi:predicted ATP-dependent endonuclease of OLD family
MYISALRATGYRNLNTTIELCKPLAVIVGENNAGKSNVIDALRTVLEPEAGPRARCWLREDDFAPRWRAPTRQTRNDDLRPADHWRSAHPTVGAAAGSSTRS